LPCYLAQLVEFVDEAAIQPSSFVMTLHMEACRVTELDELNVGVYDRTGLRRRLGRAGRTRLRGRRFADGTGFCSGTWLCSGTGLCGSFGVCSNFGACHRTGARSRSFGAGDPRGCSTDHCLPGRGSHEDSNLAQDGVQRRDDAQDGEQSGGSTRRRRGPKRCTGGAGNLTGWRSTDLKEDRGNEAQDDVR
jgi:hypothetical protein